MYTPEETAANRRNWTTALRSGKYTQTVDGLHDKNGFCCLGVACDISGLGEWRITTEVDDDDDTRPEEYLIGTESVTDLLPSPVQNWLGLRERTGKLTDHPDSVSLTTLNDVDQWNFTQIADFIESEPDGLLASNEEVST